MAFNVDKFHRQGKCVCDGEKKEKDESSREDKNEEGEVKEGEEAVKDEN